MKRTTFTRATLLAGATALGMAWGAAGAYAQDAKVVTNKGGEKVKLSLSGQFTRQIHYLDDGRSERFHHEDSNLSSSRIRFHADGKINSDLSVSGLWEAGIDDARNGGASNTTVNGGRSGNDVQSRIVEIRLKHKAFGTLYLGSGNGAANGIMNTNTNGVFGAISTATGLILGNGAQFINEATGNAGGATAAAFQVFPDFDFSSRQSRIRYDTPVIGGFMVSLSQADNQTAEVALRYSGRILDTAVKAGLGFTEGSTNRGVNTTFGGQGGAKNGDFYGAQIGGTHSSGIGANFIYGFLDRDPEENNTSGALAWEAQLHYGKKFSELGKTTLVGEFVYTENMSLEGDIGKSWSVILAQDVDAAAMNTYLRFTQAELSRDGFDFDDLNVVTLGTRVKF